MRAVPIKNQSTLHVVVGNESTEMHNILEESFIIEVAFISHSKGYIRRTEWELFESDHRLIFKTEHRWDPLASCIDCYTGGHVSTGCICPPVCLGASRLETHHFGLCQVGLIETGLIQIVNQIWSDWCPTICLHDLFIHLLDNAEIMFHNVFVQSPSSGAFQILSNSCTELGMPAFEPLQPA